MKHVQSLMQQLNLESTRDPLEDFIQLPGLYRRWELHNVVDDDGDYRIECAGELADKTTVFFVFKRVRSSAVDDLGIPVTLVFKADRLAVPARLVRIDAEKPSLLAVTLGSTEDAVAYARVLDLVARSRSLAELDGDEEANAAVNPIGAPAGAQ